MIFLLIIILVIIFLTNLLLKKKNFSTKKIYTIELILLVSVILIILSITIFFRRHEIIFFFQSLQYENIDDYDYSNDITTNGNISKDGAIKIAKEYSNCKRIAKVTCELVKNGTYTKYEKNLSTNKAELIEKQATYWNITMVTGWDYFIQGEKIWNFKIDYYSGEILFYNTNK